jgi:hypothetical protein
MSGHIWKLVRAARRCAARLIVGDILTKLELKLAGTEAEVDQFRDMAERAETQNHELHADAMRWREAWDLARVGDGCLITADYTAGYGLQPLMHIAHGDQYRFVAEPAHRVQDAQRYSFLRWRGFAPYEAHSRVRKVAGDEADAVVDQMIAKARHGR